MIIGYVLKFNYALPYNASYLTDPYVRYDRSISRRVQPDGNDASPSKGLFFLCFAEHANQHPRRLKSANAFRRIHHFYLPPPFPSRRTQHALAGEMSLPRAYTLLR